MIKDRKLTLEQISEANTLLQELVEGVRKRHEGKGGINALQAYDLIDKIHEIIHGENGNDN